MIILNTENKKEMVHNIILVMHAKWLTLLYIFCAALQYLLVQLVISIRRSVLHLKGCFLQVKKVNA